MPNEAALTPNASMLFYEQDARFAEVLQGVAEPARLIAVGLQLGRQSRLAIQRFADGAHAHFAAMQVLALDA